MGANFEPGSSHVAHVQVTNKARKPYNYRLTFMLTSDYAAIVPQVLGYKNISLEAGESGVIDMEITFWGFEVLTYLQISGYEETTETPLGVLYEEEVNLEIVSQPEASITLYWD
ncbi:MAG: hypothetical protein PHO67_07730 [Candidatus Omnitrophica bacterium]|nr:hypothetical protein [Candidatus Omnitrophota bacterium]